VNYHQKLSRMELFAGLTTECLDDIQSASQVADYSGRTVICQASEPAECVFAVLSGQIQIYRGSDGKHAVLLVISDSEVFGLRSVLTTGCYTETAEAVSDCRILEIPASAFLGIVERDPRFAAAIAHTLSQRLQSVSDNFERIQLMPAPQRLADYLIRFAPGNGAAYEIELPFEKKLIANYLGMEPESFSRAMKKLHDHGLICEGRKVRVRDPKTLMAIRDGLDAHNGRTTKPGFDTDLAAS
jgi:CRP-like cAMP-binding protein